MMVLLEKEKEKAPSKKLKEKIHACITSFQKLGNAAPGKSVEHNELDALILENSELKEALKRQTTLLRADQVSANKITFIVPQEKFIQLKEPMETSRDSIRLVLISQECWNVLNQMSIEQQQYQQGDDKK
jgi:hypothetical protein